MPLLRRDQEQRALAEKPVPQRASRIRAVSQLTLGGVRFFISLRSAMTPGGGCPGWGGYLEGVEGGAVRLLCFAICLRKGTRYRNAFAQGYLLVDSQFRNCDSFM